MNVILFPTDNSLDRLKAEVLNRVESASAYRSVINNRKQGADDDFEWSRLEHLAVAEQTLDSFVAQQGSQYQNDTIAELYVVIAVERLNAQEPQHGINAAKKGIRHGNLHDFYYIAANLMYAAGMAFEVIEFLQETQAERQKKKKVSNDIGTHLDEILLLANLETGQPKKAIGFAKKILEIIPENYTANLHKALAHILNGPDGVSEAIPHLVHASNNGSHVERDYSAHLGDLANAIRMKDKFAIKENYLNMGRYSLMHRFPGNALSALFLRKAHETLPAESGSQIFEYLSVAAKQMMTAGSPHRVVRMLEGVAHSDFPTRPIAMHYAHALVGVQQFKEAADSFTILHRRYPNDPYIKFMLGFSLEKSGRMKEALQSYADMLGSHIFNGNSILTNMTLSIRKARERADGIKQGLVVPEFNGYRWLSKVPDLFGIAQSDATVQPVRYERG